MQAFLCDGDQHVGGYGDPDLRLHSVLAGTEEHLDAQVLLDPLEEQLDLPALTIQIGDHFGLQRKVVGQEHQPLASVVLDHYPTQRRRVVLARIKHRQHSSLVAQHRRVEPIHRVRVAPLELGIALGTRDEECLGLVDAIQPCKVQVAAIQEVERACLEAQLVQRIDVVCLAVRDVNEAGYGAPQVQQRVQLDGGLRGAKRRPGEHRQTQVDSGGVERVDRSLEVQSKGLVDIHGPRHANQVLGKIGVDLPRARSVCVGQRVARNRLTTKPHVIQASRLSAQVDLDVAQGLAVGQLRKGHGEELVQAREVLDLVFAPMLGYTATKRAERQIEHELRKYELAFVHGFGRKSAKNPESGVRRSNRDQTEAPYLASKSLTYDVPT
jgi:hypothetical protein